MIYYYVQVAAVIRIQAFWRAKRAKRDYKQLGMYVCIAIYIHSLINPRHACAARVMVVGSVYPSVCLSLMPHLTSGASVHP